MCRKSEFKAYFSLICRIGLPLVVLSGAIACLVLALVLGAAATATAAGGPGAPGAGDGGLDLVATVVPVGEVGASGASEGDSPCVSGARLVRFGTDGATTVLSAGLDAACDPAVDPAARFVVFRGRESATSSWRIWRLDLASGSTETGGAGDDVEPSGSLRPLTPATMSCVRPLVLADGGVGCLCDGDLVRTVAAPAATAENGEEGAPELSRLTSSGGSLDGVALLPDGRLLLTTTDADGAPVLLTSQPDGTWATRWRDDPLPGLLDARPLGPDALLLSLGSVSETAGDRLWLGSLTDPFAALRPLGARDGAATVREPSPLPGGELVAAVRPAPGERFRIERLTAAGGPEGVLASPDGDARQPVALVPRPPGTQIPTIVKPELNTGYLVLFDAARTDVPALTADAGFDRRAIAAVRVFPWADGARAETAVDLEPAEDGSLYLEVPADRPLGIALVDRSGALLGPAGGPFWVRPNERRACMGCHVSRRYAPPNVRPRALLDPPRWVGWGAERVSPRSELEEGRH